MTILGEEDDEVSWEQVDIARWLIMVEDDVLRLIIGGTGAKAFSTGEPADALAPLKEDLDVDVGFVRFDRLLILGIDGASIRLMKSSSPRSSKRWGSIARRS